MRMAKQIPSSFNGSRESFMAKLHEALGEVRDNMANMGKEFSKLSKYHNTFASVFLDKLNVKRKQYLAEYLLYNESDVYFAAIQDKLLKDISLSVEELNHVDQLMVSCPIEEIYINKLLMEDGVDLSSMLDARILHKLRFITTFRDKLPNDRDKMIVGCEGTGILHQYTMKGFLTPNQLKEIDRIYDWISEEVA